MNDEVDAVGEPRLDTHAAPVGFRDGRVTPRPTQVTHQPAHFVGIVGMLKGTVVPFAASAIVPVRADPADS
eukprot:117239-Alexandrium_andersonii.AAC.1